MGPSNLGTPPDSPCEGAGVTEGPATKVEIWDPGPVGLPESLIISVAVQEFQLSSYNMGIAWHLTYGNSTSFP